MPEKVDNRIYEEQKNQEKWQEQLKQYKLEKEQEKQTWENLSKKIAKIDNKLSKLSWKQDGRDFFIRNMNDYIQSKFWVKFEKTSVWWKEELVLVIPKEKQATPDPIKWLEKLANNLIVNKEEIFVDENDDKKLNKDEMGIKFDTNWELETNAIYVDKNELKNNNVDFWKVKYNPTIDKQRQVLDKEYTHWGKIIFENWKSYYEVWWTTDKNWHYDYLSAVSRLFTAISTEYLWWMDLKTIDEKIKNLWYNKKTWEFKTLKKGEEKWFVKIWNINSQEWKHIVQPEAKIDLSSLSKALTSWKVEKQTKVEKKEVKNNIDWGRFYESTDGETWDIPDNWNINYKWYSESFSWLNWSQISISARNDYDFWNKDKWLKWINTFSEKKEVDLWKDKKWYLVIWETSDTNDISKKIKWLKDIKKIQNALKNSKTEAWFTTVDKKWNATITEVWDPKVQTVTETSDTVERWKDKNHPIVLNKNVYEFSGAINGNITFNKKFSIDYKNSNLKNIQSQKNFKQAFGWEKAYLLVKNHLVELSWGKEKGKETIISTDLCEQKNVDTKFDNWWVTIENSLFSDMKFDKKTWKVEFPEVTGWGKINWKLEKSTKENKEQWIKEWDILFKLWEEYKIWWKEVSINLWQNKNNTLKPNEIFEKTIEWLLLIASEKWDNFWKDISIDTKWNSIIVSVKNNISLNKLPENNILSFDRNKKENPDTYIIDAIKDKFKKNNLTKKADKLKRKNR